MIILPPARASSRRGRCPPLPPPRPGTAQGTPPPLLGMYIYINGCDSYWRFIFACVCASCECVRMHMYVCVCQSCTPTHITNTKSPPCPAAAAPRPPALHTAPGAAPPSGRCGASLFIVWILCVCGFVCVRVRVSVHARHTSRSVQNGTTSRPSPAPPTNIHLHT